MNDCSTCRKYNTPECAHKEDHQSGIMTETDLIVECFRPKNPTFGPLEKAETESLFFGDKGAFQPIIFAKALMEDYVFKTMRDNEALFVYDPKKGIYQEIGESIVKEEMAKRLDDETRKHYYDDILFFIKASTLIERPKQAPGAIALENGILNVKGADLLEYDPAYFITTAIPVFYDPKAGCPKIKKFLEDVVGPEQLDLMQETIGYCLLNELPIHKALMLIGDGANGKGTLLKLITKLLGKENVCNVSLQALCNNRFATFQLYGKIANIFSDLPNNALEHTGMFKMLTGDDDVSYEQKFKQAFSGRNTTKLLFSTNQIPITYDETTAFFRRWNLIVCDNVFIGEKCNLHILEEITTKEEMSGLLNYALEGLRRLLKNGKFSTTENIEELRAQYIRKSNSAKAFIEENLEYDPDKNAILVETDLYEKYIVYCKTLKLPTYPKGNFTQNIHENIPQAKQTKERIMGKPTRVWQFLKFVPTVPTCFINGEKSIPSQNSIVEGLDERVGTPGTPDKLLKICHFCGQPIAGDTHDWIGPGLDEPAHVECAVKYRELKAKEVKNDE